MNIRITRISKSPTVTVIKMINIAKICDRAEPKNGEYITIAINGRGASGKSSLAEFLRKELEVFTIINGDDYFELHSSEIAWGEFNEERFFNEVILLVKLGLREFALRSYDFPISELCQPKQMKMEQGLIIERC